MMMMMRNNGYIVCVFTVTVLKFVPGHCAARLVPLHQTTSAADTARLVFNSSSGHVRHRDRGDTGKNYYLGFSYVHYWGSRVYTIYENTVESKIFSQDIRVFFDPRSNNIYNI